MLLPLILSPRLRKTARTFVVGIGAACLCAAVAIAAADLDLMRRLSTERFGPQAAATVDAWRRMMEDARDLTDGERIVRVNAFFNRRLRFEDDSVIWNKPDYWASPLETMGIGAGDCEDFAIAKYMTLRLLGIPADKLRLIYVRARIGAADSGVSQAHMVVGYFANAAAEPLVLDNLIGEVRPAARRPDLTPVFSFSTDGLWVAGAQNSSADPAARLSRWRDVLERMRREGLDPGR